MIERIPLTRIILWALLYIALGVFTVVMCVVAISTYQTVHLVREGQINNKSTFALLQDCVVPDMKNKCYQRGQTNQKNILTYVEYLNVATAACADAEGTQDSVEIKACADRTLAKFGIPTQ